jgi:hypothetical protein
MLAGPLLSFIAKASGDYSTILLRARRPAHRIGKKKAAMAVGTRSW